MMAVVTGHGNRRSERCTSSCTLRCKAGRFVGNRATFSTRTSALSLHSCFVLETVSKDANVHIWVIEAKRRPPNHKPGLKHGEQAGRDLSERFRFLNDFLTANELV